MTEWVEPFIDGLEGLNSFFGMSLPLLFWIGLFLFIGFSLIFIARRFFSATL